jgi:DNA-binding transcriptional LysR family regulator
VTILQLKYFVTVCENQSLTTAAKTLFMTQPALSSAMNLLEEEFHLKLFERKNHGLILTPDGEFLYDKAKQLLQSFETLEKDLIDLSHHQYTVRIGVPPMIGSFLFPKIYQRYMQAHPDAKFEIWEEGSLTIRKKIQQGSLAVGFSILNDSTHEHYEKHIMLQTELLYCVSKHNPIHQKTDVTIEDIQNENIILLKEGFFQNHLINQMYAEVQQVPKIVLVSAQLSVIRNFIKMNAGGAFLMKELLDPHDHDIIGVPFQKKLHLQIGLIWQKDAQLHKGAIRFIQFLQNANKS